MPSSKGGKIAYRQCFLEIVCPRFFAQCFAKSVIVNNTIEVLRKVV